jgi:3-methyladenine DNA glycosylase Tag
MLNIEVAIFLSTSMQGFDLAIMAKFDEKNIITLITNLRIQIPKVKIKGTIDNAKRVLQVNIM